MVLIPFLKGKKSIFADDSDDEDAGVFYDDMDEEGECKEAVVMCGPCKNEGNDTTVESNGNDKKSDGDTSVTSSSGGVNSTTTTAATIATARRPRPNSATMEEPIPSHSDRMKRSMSSHSTTMNEKNDNTTNLVSQSLTALPPPLTYYVSKSNGWKLVKGALDKRGWQQLPFEYQFSTR